MQFIKGLYLSLVFCFALITPHSYAQTDQELIALAEELAQAISTHDYSRIEKRFDKQGFINTLVKHMQLPEKNAQSMRQQLAGQASLANVLGNAFAGMQPETFQIKVIALVRDNNETLPVLRAVFPEGGANYYELRTKKINGQYAISDIFIRANSQYMSETIAQAIVMMQDLPSGWIAALADKENSFAEVNKQFKAILAAKRSGDFQAMYDGLVALPQHVKEKDIVHLMTVMTSANLGDEIYRRELSQFARKHGNNPRYFFMLIDHYYYTKEYPRALTAINHILTRYPDDAYMLQMQATVYFEQKKYRLADTVLLNSLESEPDFEGTYWTGVTVSLADKNYANAIKWLTKYEQQFDSEFTSDNFADQDLYKEFMKSKEFKHWMMSKKSG